MNTKIRRRMAAIAVAATMLLGGIAAPAHAQVYCDAYLTTAGGNEGALVNCSGSGSREVTVIIHCAGPDAYSTGTYSAGNHFWPAPWWCVSPSGVSLAY